MKIYILIPILALIVLSSCESDADKSARLAREEKFRIEQEQKSAADQKAEAQRTAETRRKAEQKAETDRIAGEKQLEKEKAEQAIYNRFINNSLSTGSTPYSRYYGGNASCSENGCSQIKVSTSNSDVLVTIKKNDKVVRHAFIQAGDRYSFSFPNGTYQAFFYYGKGWNPQKAMKNGTIEGGFLTNEEFGKDDPQSLYNNVLEYELILQQNGNFSTRPSNPDEAL